ncbi:metallophosphoesterase [Bdellovibrio sp. 22V]|uniref:metallophosphoesterase n=1 Tax=Bdellovibrio sp. 22V TaxID=3044166 RepID=UPI002542F315|nr:metallophosphoesterase [Bdellovibrio sp. 22V]WII70653.1 metallophosphoesterase [Bdellovibrio sp. 22V]
MGLFRTIASTLILAIFIYVSHQLTRFTDLTWMGTSAIVAFLAMLFSMVIGTFLFFWKEKNLDHKPWRDFFLNGSLMVMAYINFLVSFVILRDIFAFAENLIATKPLIENLYSSQATAALLTLPVALLVLGNIIVQAGPRLKKVTLSFKNLSPDLENLRIVHITDLHISPSLPVSFVSKLVGRVREMNPDVIVFTGDILDSFSEKHQEEFKILSGLQAQYGIYYVPGNHEYYWDVQRGLQSFRDLGFKVLLNETAEIRKGTASLQIAGIPDPAAGHFGQPGPDFKAVQSQLKPGSFKVLLSHQPSLAKHSEKIGIDLQLSGHTHGGQFFPWNWLIVFFEKYAKGLYRIGNLQLYVNQGTGYWGPRLRLGTYCELTEIVLRKG